MASAKKTRVPLFFTHRWTRCEYVCDPWAPASRWPNNLWTPAVPSGNLRPSLSVARRPRLAIDIARPSVPAFEHRSPFKIGVIAACLLFRETSVSRDIGVSVAINTEQSQSRLFHSDWKTFPLADKEKIISGSYRRPNFPIYIDLFSSMDLFPGTVAVVRWKNLSIARTSIIRSLYANRIAIKMYFTTVGSRWDHTRTMDILRHNSLLLARHGVCIGFKKSILLQCASFFCSKGDLESWLLPKRGTRLFYNAAIFSASEMPCLVATPRVQVVAICRGRFSVRANRNRWQAKKNFIFTFDVLKKKYSHLIRVKSIDGSLPAVLTVNAQRRQQFHDLLLHGRACRLQCCNR